MYFGKRAEPFPLPPSPYVLSTTGQFDGNDGQWSTFLINIGDDGKNTRGQNFRVLVSTSSPIVLVPQRTEWCEEDEGCAERRGIMPFGGNQSSGFDETKSPQWQTFGLYNIPLPHWWPDSKKGLTQDIGGPERAQLGVDNVGLGESSLQSLMMTEQFVAEYTVTDFFMGSLGLAIGTTGPPGGTKPNFLNNLYGSAHDIASLSFGYTAGAYYRNNGLGAPGSLILGGYDSARMKDNGTSIRMPNAQNNTLVVGVNSVIWKADPNVETYTDSFTVRGFAASIDSTLPYLILPDDVCDGFVDRFGLEYDEDSQLFLVNGSAHDSNVQQNATVSFKISASADTDSDVFTSIVLPYSAFDQQASWPLIDSVNATRYFPIKRSENGMYVLGRTFLQEAYIIVDYERTNFTVAPAISEPMPQPKLVTILNTTYTPLQPDSGSGGGLSAGAIAGIVIGIVVAFVIAGIGAFLLWRKRRAARKTASDDEKPSEIDTTIAGSEFKHRRVSELTGSEAPQSPKDSMSGYYTADHKSIPPISEMSPESTPAELYSPPPERETFDYFAAGRMRRRGATRDRDSSGHNTPRTPIAELPGEDAIYLAPGTQQNKMASAPKPPHNRSPSDTSLSTNIDEVLAGKGAKGPATGTEESKPAANPGDSATAEEIANAKAEASPEQAVPAGEVTMERRPSHTRGLSDTTIQSDSTAVSQPTPEELERWARSVDDGPTRPMSP